jgi:hypothetical protein
MGFGPNSRLGDVMDSPSGRAILARHMTTVPMWDAMELQARYFRVQRVMQVLERTAGPMSQDHQDLLYTELASVDDAAVRVPEYQSIGGPAGVYSTEPSGFATAVPEHQPTTQQWSIQEVTLRGPDGGNPFVDVELFADFTCEGRIRTVRGFYDGGGRYLLRFMPDTRGRWTFQTRSNVPSLSEVTGTFECTAAPTGSHGPVRVHKTFHFEYADGTLYGPVGTTAYAWTHQNQELEDVTLETLRTSGFTKLRMCVFPKWYDFNIDEPPRYPFEGSTTGGWDYTRPNPEFFQHLERRIADLSSIGVQADLILFHPYDKWGFSDMGPEVDLFYVRYVIARLASFSNVWWSLANEYDLVASKTLDEWRRIGETIEAEDPYGHPRSIHNWMAYYDNCQSWVTHASIQKIETYLTAERTTELRQQWYKPVVIDECGYEGDIEWNWGNLSGREMVRRFWEGALRGGYVGHGETYSDPNDVIWWSKGGALRGESPPRIAFLRTILESAGGHLEPLFPYNDHPWASAGTNCYLAYLGFMQPRALSYTLPSDRWYTVDVIDTWNMTTDRVVGTFQGAVKVDLPARSFMAVRFLAVDQK